MLPSLSPVEVYKRLQAGEIRLVDVREADELSVVSVPGAEAAPLSALPFLKLEPATEQKPIVFMCNSGSRTRDNADVLERVAAGPAWLVLGGVSAWEKAGLPVERHEKCPLPMNRQIQIGAGALVLFGLLASCVFPVFVWLSAFVGAGLIYAGLTGVCGMAKLLAKMPWNKK